jgi:hypothetical protein
MTQQFRRESLPNMLERLRLLAGEGFPSVFKTWCVIFANLTKCLGLSSGWLNDTNGQPETNKSN